MEPNVFLLTFVACLIAMLVFAVAVYTYISIVVPRKLREAGIPFGSPQPVPIAGQGAFDSAYASFKEAQASSDEVISRYRTVLDAERKFTSYWENMYHGLHRLTLDQCQSLPNAQAVKLLAAVRSLHEAHPLPHRDRASTGPEPGATFDELYGYTMAYMETVTIAWRYADRLSRDDRAAFMLEVQAVHDQYVATITRRWSAETRATAAA